MEYKYYFFWKPYDTSLYENELFKLYNSTLTKCTHLLVKLHLADTTFIAILLGKYKTWSQVENGKRDGYIIEINRPIRLCHQDKAPIP